MIKVLVKDNGPKAVQTALINGLSRSVRQLNSEDYNYASILSSISLFESYAKLAATYLGMNVEVKFTIGHSSKGRVNLLNTTVPRANIKDINAAFRSNYNILVNFVAQVETVYLNAFKDYESLVHTFNLEVSEYNDSVNEWTDNINELTEALSNAGFTNEEIQEVINEAREETEAQIEENIRDAEDLAQEVWDTNKGYETSSQIQEDAIKAAEEYAENSAQAHDAKVAQEEANAAATKADEALAALEAAKAELEESYGKYENAVDNATKANEAYDNALAGHGAALDVQAAANEGNLPTAGETAVIPGTADPNSVVTITNNGDGTYTYTVENSSGATDTRTSTLSDIVNGTDINNAKSEVDDTAKEARDAQQQARDAKEDYDKANDKHTEAIKDYDEAQAKADKAQQEADDASIPYATDDELENGWDGSNNTEDDYGEDNWGDWSDIVGEGIEDTEDDDSEDTED